MFSSVVVLLLALEITIMIGTAKNSIIMNTRTSSVVTPQQQHNQKRIQRLLKSVPSNLSVTYHHVFLEIYQFLMNTNKYMTHCHNRSSICPY